MEYKFCGGQKLLAEKSREIWSEMCPGTKGWVWKICNPENHNYTTIYMPRGTGAENRNDKGFH